MNKLSFHRARKGDEELYVALEMELVDYHHELDPRNATGKQARAFLRKDFHANVGKKNACGYFIKLDDEAIGFINFCVRKGSPFDTQKRVGEIGAAYIRKEYRRKNFGNQMVKFVKSWFKEKGVSVVYGNVHGLNKLGNRFWQKMDGTVLSYNYMMKIK